MKEKGKLPDDDEAVVCYKAYNMLINTILVCGHPGVSSANIASATRMRIVNDDVKEEQEQVVHCYGNFMVDCAASPCVDWTRTTSNDLWEVHHTLGIEACAQVLFEQLKAVISFDGQYVDERHLMVIVDSMCRNGKLVPSNRHGINRAATSPLMRASFEETIDVLCDAAAYSEIDETAKGATPSIMTGQLAKFGTGHVDVLFHERCLAKNTLSSPSHMIPAKRVLRSVCRSFIPDKHAEDGTRLLEYTFGEAKTTTCRAMEDFSQSATMGAEKRHRSRFRSVSPTKV